MHSYDLADLDASDAAAEIRRLSDGGQFQIRHMVVLRLPYETSAAMARIGCSRLFRPLPNLKIITHHLGAMVPFLEARVGLGLDQLGTREGAEPAYAEIIANMKKKGRRPVDYFRMFFADTAINGSRSGTRCGIDFFGCEHVLFGTDARSIRRRSALHPRHHQGAGRNRHHRERAAPRSISSMPSEC